jgi:hypothetical protein
VRNTAFAPDVGSLAGLVAFGTDNAANVYLVNINNGSVFKLEP